MTVNYPVSEPVKRMPCKCGHPLAEHHLSPDMSECEPCKVCANCPDFWADFDE